MNADVWHVNMMKSLLWIKYIFPNSHTVIWKPFFSSYHSSSSLFLVLNCVHLPYYTKMELFHYLGLFSSSNQSFFNTKSYSKMILKNSKYVLILLIKHTRLLSKTTIYFLIFNISNRLGTTKTHNASQSLYMRCVA